METGFIAPIERLQTFTEIKENTLTNDDEGIFQSIFQNAIDDVTDTQKNLEHKQYLLATGQLDDAHTVTIAAEEAQLSVDMLVELRNKALEAYNELIRIGL